MLENKIKNKDRKARFSFFMLLMALTGALFLLSSCTDALYNTPKEVNYYQGTKGLELSFLQQTPPDEIYEDATFNVNFLLENRGAVDVLEEQYGILSLSVDPFYIDISGLQKTQTVIPGEKNVIVKGIQLSGKSRYHPTGYQTFLSISNFKVKPIKGQREQPSTSIFASLCYPYNTVLTELVCVDLSAYGENLRKQTCQQKDLSLSSQGAPVAITEVEVDNQPVGNEVVRPVFVIQIENKGTGSVLSPAYEAVDFDRVCSFTDLNREDFNTIQVTAFLSQSKQLECSPNPVKLIEGEGFTRCQVKDEDLILGHQNYEAPLSVNLSYVYLSSVSKEIKIKRLNVYGSSSTQETGCLPFEVEYGGKCINKCEFCSMNKGGSFCQPSTGPTVKYDLGGFGCQCSEKKCSELYKEGLCAYTAGYNSALCPGASYCCQQKCSTSEVLVQGSGSCYPKCSSSKCAKTTKECACGTGTAASGYELINADTYCCPATGDSYVEQANCNEACT